MRFEGSKIHQDIWNCFKKQAKTNTLIVWVPPATYVVTAKDHFANLTLFLNQLVSQSGDLVKELLPTLKAAAETYELDAAAWYVAIYFYFVLFDDSYRQEMMNAFIMLKQ